MGILISETVKATIIDYSIIVAMEFITESNKKTTINIRIDPDDKANARVVFDKLGLDMSTAINMFLKQVVIEQGFPFKPTLSTDKNTE